MVKELLVRNKRQLFLSANLYYPNQDQSYPAVILLHGFTGYQNEEHILSLAQFLSQNGFLSITFDASGFGESEGNLENDYRFSNYLQDIETVYEYLISIPYVDINRIGIWGNSMGAMLAIIYATQNKNIKAVCAVSSPVKMGTTDLLKKELPRWKETGYWSKVSSRYGEIKIPYSFIEEAQKWEVLDYVSSINKPLFIIIGDKDEIVRPSDTRIIYDKANKPKELLEIKGMSHLYKKDPNKVDIVNKAVLQFFDKTL